MDETVLTFHLAGINNQNFLMRDEQTGSYWQQISGRAISGPMRGKTLPFVHSDEISFAVWRDEQPQGRVLAPVAGFVSDYEPANWDRRMAKIPVVIQFPHSELAMRDQVLGIANASGSRAFPVEKVLKNRLVLSRVGDDAVVLVAGPDNLSVRAFRNFDPPRDFYRLEGNPALFTDATSGSQWNFEGCAMTGTEKGRCLERVRMVKDYWFDWKNYHPTTTVF